MVLGNLTTAAGRDNPPHGDHRGIQGTRDVIRLVHLSDIHFTASKEGLARRNRSLRHDLLNDLKKVKSTLGSAQAVLVTGDIAFTGHPDEYAVARSWLDEVCDACGVPKSAVLCVPGNHDVNRELWVRPIVTLGSASADAHRARWTPPWRSISVSRVCQSSYRSITTTTSQRATAVSCPIHKLHIGKPTFLSIPIEH